MSDVIHKFSLDNGGGSHLDSGGEDTTMMVERMERISHSFHYRHLSSSTTSTSTGSSNVFFPDAHCGIQIVEDDEAPPSYTSLLVTGEEGQVLRTVETDQKFDDHESNLGRALDEAFLYSCWTTFKWSSWTTWSNSARWCTLAFLTVFVIVGSSSLCIVVLTSEQPSRAIARAPPPSRGSYLGVKLSSMKNKIGQKIFVSPLASVDPNPALKKTKATSVSSSLPPDQIKTHKEDRKNCVPPEINFLTDLPTVGQSCDTVIVRKLTGNTTLAHKNLTIPQADLVAELRVTGQISQDWLEYLLTKFGGLTDLVIEAESCVGPFSKNRLNENVHEEMVEEEEVTKRQFLVKNLKRLTIENINFNSSHCQSQSIVGWILDELTTPKIEKLQLNHCRFETVQDFSPVRHFLVAHQETLSTVIVSKSFLCQNCTIYDVDFANLKSFQIFDPLEEEAVS